MQMRLQKLFYVYLFSFLISLHSALLVYSSSVFLSGHFGEKNIWIIYSLAAVLVLTLNFTLTRTLKKIQIESITNWAVLLAGLNMFAMAFLDSPFFIFIGFLIYIILSEYLITLTSVMVEDLSLNKQTGSIRGRYLAMQNTGFLLAPFLSAFVIKYFDFSGLFIFSSLFTILAFYLFVNYVKQVPRIIPHELRFRNTLRHIWNNHDIRIINIAQFTQYIFFTGLIIYIPFKLDQVGINITTYLSVMLPIALLPFLLIPSWLGHLEDKLEDEKTWIILAFFGQAISLVVLVFMNTSSVFYWTLILFTSRLFAAIGETSINSYFFKKVYKTDTPTIAFFASSKQFAFLLGTPVMGLLYVYGNLNTIFLSIAFLLVFVIVLLTKIHDTHHYEKHKTHKEIWRRIKKRA